MKSRRGAALMETAIAASILLPLLAAIMDLAQVLFVQQALADRARVGARYAAFHDADAAKTTNMVRYNTSTPAADARPLFGLTSEMVRVKRLGANTAADRVEVAILGYAARTFSLFLYRRIAPREFSAVHVVESAR
jgi:Flp pilus assembly protein TadG